MAPWQGESILEFFTLTMGIDAAMRQAASCQSNPLKFRPPINTARHGACAAAFAGYLYVPEALVRPDVKRVS